MASKISICSNAGLLLGQDPISDLSETSDKATLAFNLYDYVRDSVIRANNWACCIKRVVLSPDTAEPVFGSYAYQYTLPGDWLKVLSITSDQTVIDHVIEGQKILANVSTVNLRYVFRNVDEASYDAGLVDVMTAAMAAAICQATTSSEGLMDRMQQSYMLKLRQHRSADSSQGTKTPFLDSPLMRAHSIGQS
jgi:hypothetical protein